jgi:hypothetical protein
MCTACTPHRQHAHSRVAIGLDQDAVRTANVLGVLLQCNSGYDRLVHGGNSIIVRMVPMVTHCFEFTTQLLPYCATPLCWQAEVGITWLIYV